MNFQLYLDESGDHGLAKLNPEFPVFLLCGILIKEDSYSKFDASINKLKQSIWKNKDVIFHSRDIRKCEKEFQKLFDLDIKKEFYNELNSIISKSDYAIVASAINKTQFIESFGKLQDDVYEVALSFVIERTILILDEHYPDAKLSITIEKRGKKEDKALDDHFQRIIGRGTGKLTAERFEKYAPKFTFKDKRANINGLQLADLLAYPIARNVIEPNRANPAFEVLQNKIYVKNGELKGLKIYP